MIHSLLRALLPISIMIGLLGTGGCSSKTPVSFNLHTDPEGAHVVYRQDDDRWIYMGVTPLDAVEVFDEDHTFTLKMMRCGYLEQAKEWTGEELLQENKEKGMIFWTPRLVKDTQ